MNDETNAAFAAADIGNSRLKVALFQQPIVGPLPQPVRMTNLVAPDDDPDQLIEWFRPYEVNQIDWWLGSVNRQGATLLVDWLRDHGAVARITMLSATDLPLQFGIERPDMVGIDRLLAALAANRLRAADRAAVVVDLGSAITVDLLSADGVFCGGAILPGIDMSARAMHQFTDLLPLLDMRALNEPPAVIGTSTVEAMTSGLYWGAIGGIRELVSRIRANLGSEPDVFLTGGAAAGVAELIDEKARYVPNLILAGIALAASS
jgi:type III pantothenate kinase